MNNDLEKVQIPGPGGILEGVISAADPQVPLAQAVAVVCHPHSLHGGTLRNKVVHSVAESFNRMGVDALRFNFRGVEASEGSYDDGHGETEDLLTVLEWVRRRYPSRDIWLAGFSFGAYVVLRAATETGVAKLLTIAPPVNFFDFSALESPAVPWLLIQGEDDEVVPCDAVLKWARSMQPPPTLIQLPDVGHFFHGKLTHLMQVLQEAWQRL